MSVITYSLKVSGDKYLSKNFQVKEFASHDGADIVKIDTNLVTILQDLRDHFGKAVTISSGYRTVYQNKKSGGANASYHVRGQAADVVISGVQPSEIAKYLESKGVKGIGLYMYTGGHFVHCDTRTVKYYWKQTSTSGYYSVSGFGGAVNTVSYYMVNAVSGLKLRSSMSTSVRNNVICIMPNKSKVIMQSYGSSWCKIKYGTRIGYCATQFLKKI